MVGSTQGLGRAKESLAREAALLAQEMGLQSMLKLLAFARPQLLRSDHQHSCQGCQAS